MEKNYLPQQATITEACEWLHGETGEPWTLARLIEHSLMPWFWLDYQAGWPDEVFNGRTEGYLAPMCFTGDTQRLAAGGRDVLVTMTRTPSGEFFGVGVSPLAVSFPTDDLRFLRADITQLASKLSKPADAPGAKVATVERSITKQQVINAFEGVYFDRAGWKNALEDVPKWIKPCLVSRGRKGDKTNPSTWNPVLIAAALFDKGITPKELDAVFVRLKDWAAEWSEESAKFRD